VRNAGQLRPGIFQISLTLAKGVGHDHRQDSQTRDNIQFCCVIHDLGWQFVNGFKKQETTKKNQRWLGWLGAGFISVCLETRWLGHFGGFRVPECYCSVYVYGVNSTVNKCKDYLGFTDTLKCEVRCCDDTNSQRASQFKGQLMCTKPLFLEGVKY